MPPDRDRIRVLERIATGDGSAMRDLIEVYGDLLWSLARRLSRSDTEAEEAVQDILVYLWQRAPKFDPSLGEETTFVSIVARRRLIDRLRRQGRSPLTVTLTDQSPETGPVVVGEEAKAAREAFDSLPQEQQSILRLSIVHGRTHQMISDDTGLPLGTVKTHIRRGLAQIRQRLEREAGSS